jgi:hypothetical protein
MFVGVIEVHGVSDAICGPNLHRMEETFPLFVDVRQHLSA